MAFLWKRTNLHARRRRPTRLQVERLEDRLAPTTNVVELEPNNTMATANRVPLGFDAGEDTRVTVNGGISTLGDRDWLRVQLNAGDVIGGAVRAQNQLNPTVRVVDSAGTLLWFLGGGGLPLSDDRPPDSPLPKDQVGDAAFDYVISTTGDYFIEVAASADGSAGGYKMELVVARPALEAAPVGTKQILFVDFDGATTYAPGKFWHNKRLSPLSSFLSGWGLTAADEDAVIDATLAVIRENLSQDIRARGLNGDFAASGVPGQFDIEIRNSRDHADEFGANPYVSRVIIGGSRAELGGGNVGIAQFIDPGNFSFDDDAVVMLDRLSGPASDAFSLNQYAIHTRRTKIKLVGLGLGTAASHEAGHFLGNWHTDGLNASPNVMDSGLGGLDNLLGIGPDRIFGSHDDIDVDFGVDQYSPVNGFVGVTDTLNVISFGLSTGKRAAALHASVIGTAAGGVSLLASQVEPLLAEALSRWQAAGVDLSSLHAIDIRIADLGGTALGLASGHTIWLDENAAGWGWFVDPTPWDDSEFTTPGDQGEQGRMDLLTAIAHELGHLLGYEHSDDGVMADTLDTAIRTMPGQESIVTEPIVVDSILAIDWFGQHLRDRDDRLDSLSTLIGRSGRIGLAGGIAHRR